MPDTQPKTAKVIRKNADGTVVVQFAGGATKVVPLASLGRPAAPSDSRPAAERGSSVLDSDTDRSAYRRHSVVDNALDTLPTAFGTGFSIAGGGKELPTGVGMAALGGAAGEGARELLGRLLYTDQGHIDALPGNHPTANDGLFSGTEEAAKKMGTAALEQGAGELAGRGIGGTFNKLMKMTGLKGAATSAAAAKLGEGVQLTPGEASGNRAVQALEHFLPVIPGAMAPMERFDEKRAGQTATMLGKQLESISERRLSHEQAGAEVKAAMDKAQDQMTAELNKIYEPIRTKLKVPAGHIDPADLEKAAAKKGTAAVAELREANKAFAIAKNKADARLIDSLTSGSVPAEAIPALVKRKSLAEIRELLPRLPEKTKQSLRRSIAEDMFNAGVDPSTGSFNAQAGLKQLQKMGTEKSTLLLGKDRATIEYTLRELEKIQHKMPFETLQRAHRMAGAVEGAAGLVAAFLGYPKEATEALIATGGASRLMAFFVTNPETAVKALTVLRRVSQRGVSSGLPAMADLIRGQSDADDAWRTDARAAVKPRVALQ